MASIYIALFLIILWLECDIRVNTDNLLEKIGLGTIAIGCMVSLWHTNNLITYGAFMYFASVGFKVFMRKRRATDKHGKA